MFVSIGPRILLSGDLSLEERKVAVNIPSGGGGGSALSPTWSTYTPTIAGLGTGTVSVDYARYYIFGKIMFLEFSITQTAAGSGTTDVTITPPGGVTVLDSENCGSVSSTDSNNNNIYQSMNLQAFNSANNFKIKRTDTLTYIRGGNLIGNNGVVNYSFNGIVAIA